MALQVAGTTQEQKHYQISHLCARSVCIASTAQILQVFTFPMLPLPHQEPSVGEQVIKPHDKFEAAKLLSWP